MMKKTKIFLASPISGFQNEQKYISYRESVLTLIHALSQKYDVHSEIQEIQTVSLYDTPEDSVRKDFKAIDEADVFILLHPIRIQSSTLVELGYACARRKTLLLIGSKDNLPYMALGLKKPDFNAEILYSSEINQATIDEVILLLENLISVQQ